MVAVGRPAAKDRLFLADDALRGFVIMLNFLGQFLDSFRIEFFSARSNQFFSRLFVALNNLAQILFDDVVSALVFVLHVLSLHA
jgi:hypothetical protein